MYTLLVSHLAKQQSTGTFHLERVRFLEFTDDKFKVPLRGLSNEAIACLCSWPCLLMEEGRAQEIARIVMVRKITATANSIKATVQAMPEPFEITNNDLWKLRSDLDLELPEFSRNHWAVKERDLFPFLQQAGFPIKADMPGQFSPEALPVVPRSELFKARDAIAGLGHSDIDDFILKAGIAELRAGRELGSRKARADAILNFALKNPEAVTAENTLFSHFLLRQLTVLPQLTGEDRKATPEPLQAKPEVTTVVAPDRGSPNRVFVVHGRNEQARDDMVSFLASVGLEGIVLHEQPNMGRHLLTKFIDEAELVTFAVVLMTDDDEGSAKGGPLAPRARQNVILELGYFLAHLGQAKVCALISPGLETPSDFDGIVYIKMSLDGKWKKELLRELISARMPVTTTLPLK